jgi:hypothetical protein
VLSEALYLIFGHVILFFASFLTIFLYLAMELLLLQLWVLLYERKVQGDVLLVLN